MCLAIPARVVELLPGQQAVVDLSGVRKQVEPVVSTRRCQVMVSVFMGTQCRQVLHSAAGRLRGGRHSIRR